MLERVNEPCVRYSPVLVPLHPALSFLMSWMLLYLGAMIVLYGQHLTHPELKLTDPVNSLNPLLVSLIPSLLSSMVSMPAKVFT
jgi:hypothetical protein